LQAAVASEDADKNDWEERAMKSILGALLVATIVVSAMAAELPTAKPETIGLSPERLGRITDRLKADVEKRVIPGAVLLVSRHGKIGYFEAVGERDPAAKAPMTKDAIFRIYSMTKPITTVAAMMLVEEGEIALGDAVARTIPAFGKVKVGLDGAPLQRPITLQDLMRHTSGLTYGFFGDTPVKKAYLESGVLGRDMTNAEFADALATLPLGYQPGTTWDYSYSTDVLGRVVEVIEKKPLSEVLARRLLQPLEMKDTSFFVTEPARQARIAEPFAEDRTIGVGVTVFDPREAKKFESGGGGLVGTAMDYARFLEMLRQGGTLDGKRYLSPRTIAFMTADHMGDKVVPGPYYLPGDGYGFGLGFGVRKATGIAAVPAGEGEYYWGGAGGTYMWVDPKADMFVVFMMQSPKQRVPYRALLRDMVYAALTD
jgi:CubicO group peptidase (beta-lactamase class C family)